MSATTIEWTDVTWNPVTGCDRVSPGCDHCYAERIAKRFGGPDGFKVKLHPDRLDAPLHWRKPRRVFVNSMSDLFHPDIPDAFVAKVFAPMALRPAHTFQVLTKRPHRMARLLGDGSFSALVRMYADGHFEMGPFECGARTWEWPLPNVWLGVSVENQRYADLRIPHLLDTPAAVRFLSCEPLLGPISLRWPAWGPHVRDENGKVLRASVNEFDGLQMLDWVIVGGESGPGARSMNAQWARDLRDECVAAALPYFFKQWGGRTPKANGRVLDGRTWDEYPA